MKKVLVGFLVMATASAAFAWHGPHCPPPPPPHHHCDGWGRGGCNFWPGFVGGLAAGLITESVRSSAPTVVYPQTTTVVQQPVVVTQPVVVQQPATTVVTQPATTTVVTQPAVTTQVWVEGRYIDQVQANGTVVRTWQPGHYETR